MPLLLLPVAAFLGEGGQPPGKAVVLFRQFDSGLLLAPVNLLNAARVVPDRFVTVGGEGVPLAGALFRQGGKLLLLAVQKIGVLPFEILADLIGGTGA